MFAIVTIGIAIDGERNDTEHWYVTVPILGVPLALGMYWFGFRPFVRAEAEGVYVRNALRTTFIRWSEIADIESGYWGLRFVLQDGRRRTGWAIQKSNVASILNGPTRSDVVVGELLQRQSGKVR